MTQIGPKRFMATIALISIVLLCLILLEERRTNKNIFNFANNDENLNDVGKMAVVQFKDFRFENWRKLTDEQINSLSELGKILYLNYDFPEVDQSLRNYTILIWKYGRLLQRRHIYHFSDERFDPFENCSVNNCKLSYNDADITSADLVLFHLHQTRGVNELPKRNGNPEQIWTFLTDESPFHTFLHSKNNILKNYDGLFNWSMSYRMDTDIPVPYGRTVPLEPGEAVVIETFEAWNQKKNQNVLVAIASSNCGGKNNRRKYLAELQNYISVDTYGGCGKLKCPGHFTRDCTPLNQYKFYLAFENSNCDEYVTEKLWWNAFAKDAIPIVMGTKKCFYEQLLPPRSFITVEDFKNPLDLANYIVHLNNTPEELQKYFDWKKQFRVLNEHGYFRTNSVHYCRICEALNYNSRKEKVYYDLDRYWRKDRCQKS